MLSKTNNTVHPEKCKALGPRTLYLGHSEFVCFFTGREVEGQRKIRFIVMEIPLETFEGKYRQEMMGPELRKYKNKYKGTDS